MPLKLDENSLGEQKHGHMLNGKCRESIPYKNLGVYLYILIPAIHIKTFWDSGTAVIWLTVLRLDDMEIREIRRLGPTTTKKNSLPSSTKSQLCWALQKWCVSWSGGHILFIFLGCDLFLVCIFSRQKGVRGFQQWMLTIQKRIGYHWTNPFETYANVKLDHFLPDRGKNKRYLKPLPSNHRILQLFIMNPKKQATKPRGQQIVRQQSYSTTSWDLFVLCTLDLPTLSWKECRVFSTRTTK